MRLTLRTLLAYMDNVIEEPTEAEQLRKRIEESEFAGTLVQRIRHAVRRLRLGAPKIDGRGLGFDPNSVAEYLDNTLAQDRVAEFEKVCLESDQHLAEVAACHQVLALVLDEAAVVPEALRTRILGLPDAGAAARSAPAAEKKPVDANGAAPKQQATKPHDSRVTDAKAHDSRVHDSKAHDSKAHPAKPHDSKPRAAERAVPEVPDYLKRKPSVVPQVFMALLGLAAMAILAVALTGPLSRKHPIWQALTGSGEEVAESKTSETNVPPAGNNSNSVPPAPGEIPPDIMKFPEEVQKSKEQGDDAAPPIPEGPPAPEKGEGNAAPPMPPENPPEKPAPPIEEPGKEKTSTETSESNPKPAEAKTEPPRKSSEFGRYISDEAVVARFDEASGGWMRTPPRAAINVGERLVALPVYRPQFAISTGVHVTMVGESELEFLSDGEEQPMSGLRSRFGRFLIVSTAGTDTDMFLELNDVRGVLSLIGADAAAAVEVTSFLPPGEDPELQVQHTVVHIFGLNGEVNWAQEGEEPTTIPAGHVRSTVMGEKPTSAGPIQPPAWIDPRGVSVLERESAKVVEPLLSLERPLVLALEELGQHRRLDVRVQTARCLACLGKYEMILRHLSDEEYKSYWFRELDLLRAATARGGDDAANVRAEIAALRGKDADMLYRMLWGYNDAQLQRGAARELVDTLENANTDMRVVAIDNLRRITGSVHFFNPGQSPDRNRTSIIKWRKLLKEEEIKYVSAPLPYIPFRAVSPDKAKPAEPPVKSEAKPSADKTEPTDAAADKSE